jgi:hypothetical protein
MTVCTRWSLLMSSQEGRGAASLIVEPGKGDILGCRFGVTLEAVVARWPGGHVSRGGGGVQTYSLTQEVGRCAARVRARYQFVDDALVVVSLRAATEVQDGLGRHGYRQAVDEVVQGLPATPSLQDEGYVEYDVGTTRITLDALDAELRFEEIP